MTERILVCVAWPYASVPVHVGNIAGADLPPDILARYHRLKGNEVLMVSGSDTHGTPVTVRAEEEGLTAREVFEKYHQTFLESFSALGLSYDLFTHTDTENHHRIAQDIILRLHENGYLYSKVIAQSYCEHDDMFLPDRYVYGTCPHCGSDNARGDQCEDCGHLLDPVEIVNPKCKICGNPPVQRETEHLFFDLPQLNERLLEWLQDKDYWRPNVLNFTRGFLEQGLEPRAVTRDIEWGIPVPIEGLENKTIYVWIEAVSGYFTATVEWAKNSGEPEKWREWWYEPTRSYYFIGKDNIPFHTVIWPAILMGMERIYADEGTLNLPYDVPANQFLNIKGKKTSGSRNWAVWVPDYLSRYDPDPLRYYLTAVAPETADSDFTWEAFVARNNNELVGTYGNLVNRVLKFTYKNFDEQVPQPSELDEVDRELIDKVEAAFAPLGELIDGCKFRRALEEAMLLAQEANRYLNTKEPWKQINDDEAACATTLYTALRVIDSLKILFAPFLPFSSQKLHEYLGYDGDLSGKPVIKTFEEETRTHDALCYEPGNEGTWKPSDLPAGQKLRRPKPLFKKLDKSVIAEEEARLG